MQPPATHSGATSPRSCAMSVGPWTWCRDFLFLIIACPLFLSEVGPPPTWTLHAHSMLPTQLPAKPAKQHRARSVAGVRECGSAVLTRCANAMRPGRGPGAGGCPSPYPAPAPTRLAGCRLALMHCTLCSVFQGSGAATDKRSMIGTGVT